MTTDNVWRAQVLERYRHIAQSLEWLDVPRTVICGVICISCLGFIWTGILLVTLWLIAKVKTGQFDDLFSVESDLTLNTEHPITRTAIKPKRRRRIVKFSKEKRDHVQEEPEDSFNEVPIVQDDFPGGDALDRSLDQLMKNFGSKTSEPRRTPSLRSPLPLLSEIKCRISNDSRIRTPEKYSLPRSVWNGTYRSNGTFNHRAPISPFSPPPYPSHAAYQSSAALSPPRSYFSRINPQMQMDTTTVKIASPGLPGMSALPRSPLVTAKKTDSSVDSCSKEAVMKGIEESMRSKRKRSARAETSADQEDITEEQNKKRRLSSDVINTTMDQLFPTSMKENIRDKFLKSSLPARPILKKATKVVVNTVRQLNRFRLSEEETNALAFDEDEEGSEMDVEKSVAKRKFCESDDFAQPREKKQSVSEPEKLNPVPTSHKSVKKNSSLSPENKQSASDETDNKSSDSLQNDTQSPSQSQTPRQLNLRSPRQLKISYKKLFVHSFPSNLKPGSTEKRRRIPVMFGGSLDDSIEISKEEYGSRGFSYEALELDRKAATERVKAIFDDDEDDDDGTEKRKEKSVQADTIAKSAAAISPFSLLNTSGGEGSKALSLSSTPVISSEPSKLPSNTTSFLTSSLPVSSQTPLHTGLFGSKPSVQPSHSGTSVSSSSAPQGLISGALFSIASSSGQTATIQPPAFNLATSEVKKTTSSLTGSLSGQPLTVTTTTSELLSSTNKPALSSSSNTTFSMPPSSSDVPSFGGFAARMPSDTTAALPGSLSTVEAKPLGGFTLNLGSSTSFTSATFSFGAPISSSCISSTGSLAASIPAVPVTGTTSSSFNFVSPLSSAGNSASTVSTSSIAQGNSNTFGFTGLAAGNTQTISFGVVTTTAKTTQAQPFGTFAFGSSVSAVTTQSSVFGSQPPAITQTSIGVVPQAVTQTAQGLFGGQHIRTAGTAMPSSQPGQITFGASVSAAKCDSSTLFTFSAATTQVTSARTPSTQTTTSFTTLSSGAAFGGLNFKPNEGTSAATTTSTNTNLFGFTPSTSQSTQNPLQPAFGVTPSTQSTFSTSINPFAASTSNQNTAGQFSFGNASASTAASQTSIAFGKPTFTQSQNVFGATNSSASVFGSQPSSSGTNAQPLGTFSFTGASSQGSGGFNFNPAKTTQTTGPTMSFGGSQSGQNPFGGVTPFGQTAAVGTPAFGKTTTAPPVFGQSTAGIPAFGQLSTSSANQAQNTFGSSVFGQAPGAFGSASSAQPPSGGFNFTAAATAKPPATFNFGGTAPGTAGFGNPAAASPTPPAFGSPAFGTPQTPGGGPGFNIGAGASSSQRPTHRARRRLRK